MRLNLYIIAVLALLSGIITAQKSKTDSIYNSLSYKQKLAQLFVVMDSTDLDSISLANTPAPGYFILSGKKSGNLRRTSSIQQPSVTTICELTNGKITGVNSQRVPCDELLLAAQNGGFSSNTLPYLIQKSKRAGSTSFCFQIESPWRKNIDLKSLINPSYTILPTKERVAKELTMSTLQGIKHIHLYHFPSNLFNTIDRVPIKSEEASIEPTGIEQPIKSYKTIFDEIFAEEGLLFTTNYERDLNILIEAIENNIVSKSAVLKAAKQSFTQRVDANSTLDQTKPIDESLVEISIARDGVTLASNENLFLPILNIDTLSIAILTLEENPEFAKISEAVSQYLPKTKLFNLQNTDSLTLTKLSSSIKDYNTIFVLGGNKGINEFTAVPKLNVLKNLIDSKNCLLISLSTNRNLLPLKEALSLKSIVLGYELNDYTPTVIAQNIFSGEPFKGKSPFDITGICNSSQGITTSKYKLGRGIPSEVDMDGSKLNSIDDIIQLGIEAKAMPGCQVLVARRGKIIFQKNYGYDNYDHANLVTDTTLYDIASVTKITASLPMIMKLVDEKRLETDSSLQTYLPYLKTTNKGDLRIKEILTHQAGLTAFIPFYQNIIDKTLTDGPIFSNKYSNKYSVKVDERLFFNRYSIYRSDIISTIKSDTFSVQVARDLYITKSYTDSMYLQMDTSKVKTRGKYLYSDCGYYYFKKIIEKSYNTTLDTAISNYFTLPLGMFHTTYNPLNKFPINQIAPTEQDLMFRNQTVRGFVHDPGAAMLGGVGGHAGLFSTASDLAILLQMYLNGGSYGGKRYLNDSTITRFATMQFPNNRRGLGFDKPEPNAKKINPVSNYCSLQSYGHSGFSGTLVWVDPKYDLIYIFLSNRIHPNAYNKKLIKMDIRQRVQDVIYQSIIE